MRRQTSILVVALLFALVPVRAAVTPTMPEPPPRDGAASEAFALATAALAEWSQLEGTRSSAAAMSGLAAAGLDFAQQVTASDMPASAIIGSVVALVEAQARAASAIVPGFEVSAAWAADALRTGRDIAALTESLGQAAGVAGGLHLAALVGSTVGLRDPASPGVGGASAAWRLADGAAPQGAPLRSNAAGARTLGDPVSLLGDVLALQPVPARHALPAIPQFGDLGSAVEALYTWYRHAPTDRERAALDALSAAPARTAKALTRIVEGHLFMAETYRIAFATVDRNAGSDSWDLAEEAAVEQIDFGLVTSAQALIAPILMQAAADLECEDGLVDDTSPILQYDMACQDSLYVQDTLLLIDAGGDDTYENNAGGAQLGVATLVDAGGDDVHTGIASPSRARNGGGVQGVGFLIDRGGNDSYLATFASAMADSFAANGGAVDGSGFLLDVGGNDSYAVSVDGASDAGVGVNGGGYQGISWLLDTAGDDTYSLSVEVDGQALVAANGAGFEGWGMLVDARGHDVYAATVTSAIADVAANGGAYQGAGILIDGDGRDGYGLDVVSSDFNGVGANGGAYVGTGLLVDRGGDDSYDVAITARRFSSVGANGGADLGTGILWDSVGNDRYAVTIDYGDDGSAGVNGGASSGFGMLLDDQGSDNYSATLVGGSLFAGVSGGAARGVAILIDRAGNNEFAANLVAASGDTGVAAHGGAAVWTSLEGTTVAAPGGVGLLVAGPGDDAFTSNRVGQGAADLNAVGILVDAGGNNTYVAGPGGLAQGAGRNAGLGLLVDKGRRANYILLDGTTGQGAGLQGVGLVLRTSPDGSSLYHAASGALPSRLTGGGVGARVDRGETGGALPDLACTDSQELVGDVIPVGDLARTEIHICAPDDSTKEAIIDPLTGKPVPPQSKPSIPCNTWPVNCEGLVGGVLGPEAVTWLEASTITPSTSGGFLHLEATEAGSATRFVQSKVILQSADDACQVSCHTLGQLAS